MTLKLTRFTPGLVNLLATFFVCGDPSSCVLPLFIAATFESPVLSGDSIEKIGQLFGGMCRILSEYIASGGVECYPHMASGRLELRGLDSFDLRGLKSAPGGRPESPILVNAVGAVVKSFPVA